MREHERRALLVIEENLLVEAPELAALFDPVPGPDRSRRGRTAVRRLAATVLVLGLVLGNATVLLGALALLSASVVRWTVRAAGADEPGRRLRGP